MNAFLYAAALQMKLDIRSRAMLVTCYVVPLIFFLLMGGIFTSVMPEMKASLIPSMTVTATSMGAFVGLPPSLLETYGGDVRKMYKANGVLLCMGLFTAFVSAFVHLMIMSLVILLLAPVLFGAELPELSVFLPALALHIAVSLGIGCVLGLTAREQAKLTMTAQLVFLPSLMLSGIMFPAELLPDFLKFAGRIFPATWGYGLMMNGGLENLWYPLLILAVSAAVCGAILKKRGSA